MPNYYVENANSDLTPSWPNTSIFDYDMNFDINNFFSTDSHTISASTTVSAAYITESGVPNSDSWEDGGTWQAQIDVDNANMNIRGRVRAVRLTSSGGIDQSGSFTGYQTFSSTGVYTFSPVAPTWSTTEACGHRIALEWEFENIDSMMSQSITWTHSNSVGSETQQTDITEDAGTCSGGTTFTPKCVMF